MITITVGQKIKRLRKLAHMTQRELADKAYISLGALRKYESSDTKLTGYKLHTILTALDCTLENFLEVDAVTVKALRMDSEYLGSYVTDEAGHFSYKPQPELLALAERVQDSKDKEIQLYISTISEQLQGLSLDELQTIAHITDSFDTLRRYREQEPEHD